MARFSESGAKTHNDAVVKRLRGALAGLTQDQMELVVKRTLAGARRRFEPAAKRIIRKSYGVALRELSGKFQVRTGADAGGEYVALAASQKRIPLIRFGATWRGIRTPGATAIVRKGVRKTYRHAFIRNIQGTPQVLERQMSRDGGGKRDPRNRIRRLMGPSPLQMLEGEGGANATAVADEINEFIARELERQVNVARAGK